MSFRQRIVYYLVHSLGYTNKQARHLIESGAVVCNSSVVNENRILLPEDTLFIEGKEVKEALMFDYILFHKPVGVECTLNPSIKDNLGLLMKEWPFQNLYPVGRLDKQSEGLLLLTNDGRLMNKTIWKHTNIEKEYWIESEDNLDDDFYLQLKNGIPLSGILTSVHQVYPQGKNACRIVLLEGKNRQIRRMFYKCDKSIKRLLRIRWQDFNLENLKSGEWRELTSNEKERINSILAV